MVLSITGTEEGWNGSMTAIFLLQFMSCLFLCGLIWIVQLVHYPSFRYVDSSRFVKFENFHTRNISIVVLPVMIIELITAIQMFFISSSGIWSVNLALLTGIWYVTFRYSAPCHIKLSEGKDRKIIDTLITTNWLRTALWSIRALLLTYILLNADVQNLM